AEELGVWVETQRVQNLAYGRLQHRLAGELAGGRCTLADAVAELEPAARARGHRFLNHLRYLHGGRPARECLAGCLIRYCVDGQDRQAALRLALRLGAEFSSTFGTRPSQPFANLLAAVEAKAAAAQGRP